MYKLRRLSSTDEHRALRVERTAIRIWELLERMGELSVEEIREKVNAKGAGSIFNAAIRWLLTHEFAKAEQTPAGLKMKSN